MHKVNPQIFVVQAAARALDTPRVVINRTTSREANSEDTQFDAGTCRWKPSASRNSTHWYFTLHLVLTIGPPVSTVRSVPTASTIQCPPAHFTWSTNLRHISGNLNIHLDLNTNLSHLKPCVISDFRSKLDENCALLGYYAVCSGNSLSTFRDNLSAPSRVKEFWTL
jgi:hypothetical protein